MQLDPSSGPSDPELSDPGDSPIVPLDETAVSSPSPAMATENSSLLSPVDPKTLPIGLKFRWLFSRDTLGRRQNIEDVLETECSY